MTTLKLKCEENVTEPEANVASRLSSQQIESVTLVKIIDQTVGVSVSANSPTPEKSMKRSVPHLNYL